MRCSCRLSLSSGGAAPLQARDVDLEQELQRELNKMPPPATLPLPETLACYERLAAIARYQPLPIRSEPAQCATIDLVRLDRVLMSDHTEVAIAPAPALRCSMAEAIAEWVRADVGPAAAELGCAARSGHRSGFLRMPWPRNNIPGAKLVRARPRQRTLDIGSVKLPQRRAVQPDRCTGLQAVPRRRCGHPGLRAFHDRARAPAPTATTTTISISIWPSVRTITGSASGTCSIRRRSPATSRCRVRGALIDLAERYGSDEMDVPQIRKRRRNPAPAPHRS